MSDDLKYGLGLDVASFNRGAADAIDSTRKIHHAILGISRLITAGGVATVTIGFLRDMADWAEKSGDKLDANVQALIRWKQAAASTEIRSALAAPVGFVVRASEALGVFTRGMLEAGKAIFTTTGGIKERGEAAVAALELAREAHLKDVELTTKESIEAEKVKKQLEAQQKLRESLAAEAERIGRATAAYNFSQLTKQQQLNQLLAMQKAIDADIAAAGSNRLTLADLENKKAANALEIQKTRDALAKETVKPEKDITAELEAQAKAAAKARKEEEGRAEAARMTQHAYEAILFGIVAGGYDSRQVQEASTPALSEAISRNNQRIQRIQSERYGVNPGGGVNIGETLNLSRLENENRRLQAELDLRSSLQRDNEIGGETFARAQFKGDPLAFDRLYSQFVAGQSEQQKQSGLLQEIRDRLRGTLTTVPVGGLTVPPRG